MATVKAYATQLTQRARVVARMFGADPERSSKELRVLLRTVQIELAVVVKLLVDKGVVTDAELIAAFDAAAADLYPDEPNEPPP
jgi:hypothetical protein